MHWPDRALGHAPSILWSGTPDGPWEALSATGDLATRDAVSPGTIAILRIRTGALADGTPVESLISDRAPIDPC